MKKFLSFAVLLCVLFSLCTLTACENEVKGPDDNIYEDFEKFDSFVPTGSDIIGNWEMKSPETDQEWQFFANTTLHKTQIIGDISTSTVCTYNYDGEGNLGVYVFTQEKEESYTVMLEGKELTLTAEDGTVYTFTKK